VINNIAYFPSQCAQNSGAVLNAFLQSCRNAGIATVENSWDADAVVIWSVLWHGRMEKNQSVYEHYRAQNKPVIVIDVGALHRDITWKIAINNINGLGEYGHTENLDWDRPKKLGIQLYNRVCSRDSVVIATQHTKSLQVAHFDYAQWVEDTVQHLRTITDRMIVVRHHPRCRLPFNDLPGVSLDQAQKIPGTYDSFDINFSYHAMINYCSGPGIQAAIAGCPVITDSCSLAHPVSITYEELENPPDRDRERWLAEIAHTEYTEAEIADGLWLKRLNDYLV
jgi:hypothetical protein